MLVPIEWIKEYVDVPADTQEIANRLTMGGLEVEGIEESATGTVLDVYITPNRGDCLSLVGIAREIAGLFDTPLKAPTPPPSERGGEVAKNTSITILDPDLCPRYAARIVRNIRIEPSPLWMQKRLEAAGQRPINNLVDVTNYVMLELGQPLHAFDLDTLAEERVVVRRAYEGERLTTLDGVERELNPNMLVIADAERAVAIAGVMGGAESEVTETTVNLLLESAHFNPLSIRRTARAVGMRTEASYRFERVVDPDGVRRAVDRACELLEGMGQPKAVNGIVDVYPNPPAPKEITLRIQRTIDLLGIPDITIDEAQDCLRRIGLYANRENGALRVMIPGFRPDLTMEEDLVEEVGRIYGYENIPETLPIGATTKGGDSEEGQFIARIRDLLASCGMQEVVTHSLTPSSLLDFSAEDPRRVPVRNALSSEIGGLRRSHLPGLIQVAQRNATRAAQHSLALFEVGRVWQNEIIAEMHTPVEFLSVAGLLMGEMEEPPVEKERMPFAKFFGNKTVSGILAQWVKKITDRQVEITEHIPELESLSGGWFIQDPQPPVDFALVRGVVERLFQGLCISNVQWKPLGESASNYPQFHPGRTALITLGEDYPVGVIGELHPRLVSQLELRHRVYLFEVPLEALRASAEIEKRYQSASRFPTAVRDLAPRLEASVTYAEVEKAIAAANAPNLVGYRPTDIYRGNPLGKNEYGLTLSFTFRSGQGTLTEGEISAGLEAIRASLEEWAGAIFVV